MKKNAAKFEVKVSEKSSEIDDGDETSYVIRLCHGAKVIHMEVDEELYNSVKLGDKIFLTMAITR